MHLDASYFITSDDLTYMHMHSCMHACMAPKFRIFDVCGINTLHASDPTLARYINRYIDATPAT